tara:strand:+ start:8558 stop:8920 length:363 start_codon:yes stop_codon:yes gene_type:complete
MTGEIGRKVREDRKKKKERAEKKKTPSNSKIKKIMKSTSGVQKKKKEIKKDKKKKPVRKPFYGYVGAAKRDQPCKTMKNGVCRPSAGFNYEIGNRDDVLYNGKWHYMGFTADGSPRYFAY